MPILAQFWKGVVVYDYNFLYKQYGRSATLSSKVLKNAEGPKREPLWNPDRAKIKPLKEVVPLVDLVSRRPRHCLG